MAAHKCMALGCPKVFGGKYPFCHYHYDALLQGDRDKLRFVFVEYGANSQQYRDVLTRAMTFLAEMDGRLGDAAPALIDRRVSEFCNQGVNDAVVER